MNPIPSHRLQSLWYRIRHLSLPQFWSSLLVQEKKCCVLFSETIHQQVRCDGTVPNDLQLLETKWKKLLLWQTIQVHLELTEQLLVIVGETENECTHDSGFCISLRAKKEKKKKEEEDQQPNDVNCRNITSYVAHTHKHSSQDKVLVCCIDIFCVCVCDDALNISGTHTSPSVIRQTVTARRRTLRACSSSRRTFYLVSSTDFLLFFPLLSSSLFSSAATWK